MISHTKKTTIIYHDVLLTPTPSRTSTPAVQLTIQVALLSGFACPWIQALQSFCVSELVQYYSYHDWDFHMFSHTYEKFPKSWHSQVNWNIQKFCVFFFCFSRIWISNEIRNGTIRNWNSNFRCNFTAHYGQTKNYAERCLENLSFPKKVLKILRRKHRLIDLYQSYRYTIIKPFLDWVHFWPVRFLRFDFMLRKKW